MNTEVSYGEDNDNNELMHRMCKCGHELYKHGFTRGVDFFTDNPVLVVSQCVFCDCKKFEWAGESEE